MEEYIPRFNYWSDYIYYDEKNYLIRNNDLISDTDEDILFEDVENTKNNNGIEIEITSNFKIIIKYKNSFQDIISENTINNIIIQKYLFNFYINHIFSYNSILNEPNLITIIKEFIPSNKEIFLNNIKGMVEIIYKKNIPSIIYIIVKYLSWNKRQITIYKRLDNYNKPYKNIYFPFIKSPFIGYPKQTITSIKYNQNLFGFTYYQILTKKKFIYPIEYEWTFIRDPIKDKFLIKKNIIKDPNIIINYLLDMNI
jgi:hypothetical protein